MTKSLDRFLVPDTSTVAETMRRIDQTEGMVALVMEGDRLVGLVSTGDIRRGLVRGVSPDRPITEVMNPSPLMLEAERLDDRARVSEVVIAAEDRRANAVPVVDEGGHLVDLLFAEDLDALISRALRAPGASSPVPRVLLVGGAGYVGSVLSRRLLEGGFAVRVADRLLYGDESLPGISGERNYEFYRSDFRHIENMADLLTDVDAVVYLAEIVGDPACEVDPRLALETNLISVVAFATLCSHLQVNRFVYLSSCAVYGAAPDPDGWLDENSPLNPVSLYARIKGKTENSLLDLARGDSNFAPTILRLATVFGLSPRPRFDVLVNLMTARAVREGTITMKGGRQWRPNIHVDDVARAIEATLRAPLEDVRGQTLNVGDNDLNFRVHELAEQVASAVGGTQIVTATDDSERRDYRVSFDRIRSVLGFEAVRSVTDGALELSEFLRTNHVDLQDRRFSNS